MDCSATAIQRGSETTENGVNGRSHCSVCCSEANRLGSATNRKQRSSEKVSRKRMQTENCTVLPPDTPCGPQYEGFYIRGTVADFNENMRRLSDFSVPAGQCEVELLLPALESLRFFGSFQCSSEIQRLSTGCPPREDAALSTFLCDDECKLLQESTSFFDDPGFLCGLEEHPAFNHSALTRFCATKDSTAGECIKGTAKESAQCGFSTLQIAQEKCEGEYSQCCKDLLNHHSPYWYAAAVALLAIAFVGYLTHHHRSKKESDLELKTAYSRQTHVSTPEPAYAMDSLKRSTSLKQSHSSNQTLNDSYDWNLHNGSLGRNKKSSAGKINIAVPPTGPPSLHYSSDPSPMHHTSDLPNTSTRSLDRGTHLKALEAALASKISRSRSIGDAGVKQSGVSSEDVTLDSYHSLVSKSRSLGRADGMNHSLDSYDKEKKAAIEAFVSDQAANLNSSPAPLKDIHSLHSETISPISHLRCMRVVQTYIAASDDEITLTPGMELILLQEFDDGWAVGKIRGTKESGFFPVSCTREFTDHKKGVPFPIATLDSKTPVKTNTRTSSSFNYFDGESTPTLSIADLDKFTDCMLSPKVTVVHPWSPIMEDELSLTLGCELQVLETYNDGWSLGKDLATGLVGVFPSVCAQPVKPSAQTSENISKRNSSVPKYWQYPTLDIIDASTEAKALREFTPSLADELRLHKDQTIHGVQYFNDGWTLGVDSIGNRGVFPSSFAQAKNVLDDSVCPSPRVSSLVVQPQVKRGRIPISVLLSQLDDLDV